MASAQVMAPTAAIDCETVMRVFLNSDTLPKPARQMMIDGLPPATRASGGTLHPFQSQFLASVKDTLVEVNEDAARRQGEHKDKFELMQKEVDVAKAAHEAAEKKVVDATQLMQAKKSELQELEKTTAEIEKEHEVMLKVKTEEDERRAELDISKAEVTSILEGPFQGLLEGTCDEGEPVAKAVEDVEAFMKKIQAEPVLIAAAVRALAVKPDSRGEFDSLTIPCVKQALDTHLDKVNTLIDEHHSKHRSVSAEQLGLWALLDQEKYRVSGARGALVDAEIGLTSAQDECSNACKEVTAKSDAVSMQRVTLVVLDDLVKEIISAQEAVARLAVLDYTAGTSMEVDEGSAAATGADASAPTTSAAETAGSEDVSMAAATS